MCSKGWKSIPRDPKKEFAVPTVVTASVTAVPNDWSSFTFAFSAPGPALLRVIAPEGDIEEVRVPKQGTVHFHPHLDGKHYLNLCLYPSGLKVAQVTFDPRDLPNWTPELALVEH